MALTLLCVCAHARTVAQLCLTLCDLWTVAARLLCPWYFPGKNTGVGCYFLLHNNSNNKINLTLHTDTELGDIKWQEVNACGPSEMACWGLSCNLSVGLVPIKWRQDIPLADMKRRNIYWFCIRCPGSNSSVFWWTVWPLPEMYPNFSR